MKKIILLIAGILAYTCSIYAQGRKVKITIGSSEFIATLNNSEAVNTFISMLPLAVNMSEMGGYEKYHYLSESLPGSATNVGTTYEGDLMIWSGNCLVLFYTTRPTSYSYIRLGRIDNTAGLQQAVGSGNVQVRFELEGNTTGSEEISIDVEKYKILTAENYVEVSGETGSLFLYSLSGSLVATSDTDRIDTSGLNPGIYLLRINTKNEGFITSKIIKNR